MFSILGPKDIETLYFISIFSLPGAWHGFRMTILGVGGGANEHIGGFAGCAKAPSPPPPLDPPVTITCRDGARAGAEFALQPKRFRISHFGQF